MKIEWSFGRLMTLRGGRATCKETRVRGLSVVVLLLALGWASAVFPEPVTPDYPPDFAIEALAGSVAPSHSLRTIKIAADGSGEYCRIAAENRATGTCTTTDSFTLTVEQLNTIYQAVVDGDFFALASQHVGQAVDGTFAELEITASPHGTHVVRTQNMAVAAFDDVVLAINAAVPAGDVLKYNAISGLP